MTQLPPNMVVEESETRWVKDKVYYDTNARVVSFLVSISSLPPWVPTLIIVLFQVGGTLFRDSIGPLIKYSEAFAALFSLPCNEDGSDEKPYTIGGGVTAFEFRALLSFFHILYAPSFLHHSQD
jgi:hypothetical protein